MRHRMKVKTKINPQKNVQTMKFEKLCDLWGYVVKFNFFK